MSVERAIIYARISEDRPDDSGALKAQGVADQERDARALATRLGWNVWRVVIENDTSAFKRRKITLPDGSRAMRVVRPGFRSVLDDLGCGRADGLIAVDLDRAVRDPRDLEDLIDIVEERRVPVESVTGSLRLATDADITMARVLVAVANKSSRDTSRRVMRARLRAVEDGRYAGGRRPFGFESDGVTVRPDEAREIVAAINAVLEGISIREITLDLRRRGVKTVLGGTWSTSSLHAVLRRPRNAGLMVHRGEVLEVPAQWEPLVSREVFESMLRILDDPGRVVTTGNTPRWLGSGIYHCACGGTMAANTGRYRCVLPLRQTADRRSGHCTAPIEQVDAVVEATVLGRLGLPDALAALTPATSTVDLPALRAEAAALRIRLDAMAEDYADGEISRAQLTAGTKRAQARLDELDKVLAGAASRSPLAPLIGAEDVAAVWPGLPLGTQRAIVRFLVRVDIRPAVLGRPFDPSRVAITWLDR